MTPETDFSTPAPYALAIDIGGTKADIGFVDSHGRLLGLHASDAAASIDQHRVPFDEQGIADPHRLIELLAPYVDQAADLPGVLLGIGLSVCGNIDCAAGDALRWLRVATPKLAKQ